ncbi:hypothetical protein EIP91_003269, partial [Steccherinum ochraceum]
DPSITVLAAVLNFRNLRLCPQQRRNTHRDLHLGFRRLPSSQTRSLARRIITMNRTVLEVLWWNHRCPLLQLTLRSILNPMKCYCQD